LRTISYKAYYYILKEKRQRGAKFEDWAKTRILIRYEGNSIYRIYDWQRGIVRASSIVFNENDVPQDIQFNDLFNESPAPHAGGESHKSSHETKNDDYGQDEDESHAIPREEFNVPRGFGDD